ncbi:hypothetical protein Tco_1127954 [Tanacetum coccineum]
MNEKVNMEESAEEESEEEKHEDEIGIETESEDEEEMVKNTKKGQKCIKWKEPSTSKKKTMNKAEEEEENYSNSEDEEELKKVTKGKMEKGGHKKPSKQVKYPTCNTRSSPKPLFDAMSGLSEERKRCLKQMGFERYIQFPIVELPSKLAYHVIENFHSPSMELRLQKGSIKATRQKVNDILGIPMGNTKLQDLDKRPDNDPFIAEWEAQYNHLGKPTPRAIALQMSGTTKADFMFKINFLTLFGSTMGTLENGGRVPKKLVKCIKEETDISDIDWCGYILDCLHDNKHNWEKVKTSNNYYYGPLTFLCLIYLDSTFFPDLNIICHRPTIRSWNTQMMRKRIMMETSKGCLGNIEHHEDFEPDEDQNGIDLYKGLDVYIEPLSERKPVTKEGMTKFGEDQGISDLYDQYKKLFKDAEFNLYDSSMDEYSESESDADSNNKKNNDEEEKEKRNDISKGTKEAGREQKDDQDDLNNEREFEKLTGDDREVAFSMEVDETENEKEKQTENVKEQQAEKKKEKQTENEEKQNDIGKGTEEARSETKNDGEEVHVKVDDLNEQMKDKEADKQKKTSIKGKATTDEVMMTKYLFSMDGEELDFVFETKDGAAMIRDYMQTLAPQLKVESNVIDTFSLTKDTFKWKKANGKYDEEKQFEAFSKKIKSEFKKDPEMKNMKDLEMAFFPIIAHEHYYLVIFNFLKGNTVIIDNSNTQMTYEAKSGG